MARPKTKPDLQIRTLQDLGLSENEATLYALMLTRPPSTVRELGVQSPFPRTLLYHVLNQLTTRGLVSSKKDAWRTTYIAEDPENLYDLLSHKQQEVERQSEAIRAVIPQLKQNYLLAGQRPSVRMFEGVEEFDKALDDSLISGTKEIYAFEHMAGHKPALESRAAHERRRVLRKVQKKVLFFESLETLKLVAGRAYNDYTTYHGIPEGALVPFEIDVLLYNGKILYMTSYGKHEPIAILIEDKALYEMQKSLFDSLLRTSVDRTLYYTQVK
ncbi:MAG: helix-turn-helix domain-containing protein [Patescibacteria group bacterium]